MPHPLGPYVRRRGGRRQWKSQPAQSYRGGHTRVNPHGYIWEYSPDHPRSNKRGYVLQHRLVYEGMIGRLLTPRDGHVHHKNENKQDNRRENLELLTAEAHLKHHKTGTHKLRDREAVRTALVGRSTEEAAQLLGVNHQTIRNNFPDLIDKRVSPGGLYSDDVVELVRRLAADPTVSTREASARTGMTQIKMRQIRQRHGIEWVSAPLGRPSLAQSKPYGS